MKCKKLLAALSVILSVSMLAGCGQGAGTTADNGATDQATEKTDLTTSGIKTYEATDMSKLPNIAKNRKDTLIIGTTAPKGVFNPCYASSMYDTNIARTMYEKLMVPDEHGQPTNRLLKDYSVSDDGLTYTFTLKDDLVWSDGTPITSKDVAFPFYVMADPSYDGPQDLVNGTYAISGIKEYNEGKTDKISGIEIVNDKTIKFTCTNYYPFILQDITSYPPIPEAYYSQYYKHGDCNGLKETFTNPGPVSGAYKFVSYTKGQEIVMEANDKFHLGAPKIKNLIFKVDTVDTNISLLKSGEIDIDGISSNNDNVDEIESAGFLGYKNYPANSYAYISLNQTLPQFKDKAVRQALTIGLNRKKIIETAFDQYGKVINIPESSVAWTYKEPKETYDYDLEKAKKLLDDAGWKVGSDGIREKDGVKLSVHFLAPTGTTFYETLLSVLDNDWKALGVDYTGEQIDFNTLITRTDNKDFEAYCMAWGLTDIPGGDTLFPSWGSQNYNSYKNDKIDELSKQISAEHDQDKLKELYGEYYDELNEDLPYIYMNQNISTFVINGRVKGIEASSYVPFYLSLYKATIEE